MLPFVNIFTERSLHLFVVSHTAVRLLGMLLPKGIALSPTGNATGVCTRQIATTRLQSLVVCLRVTFPGDDRSEYSALAISEAIPDMPLLADTNFNAILIAFGALFLALVLLVTLIIVFKYFNLWLQAFVTRAQISMMSLIAMSFRKVNARVIVESKIMAVQAGLPNVSTAAFEAHFLSQGNVRRVVQALIVAHRAKIDLDWETATAIDLAGRNVLEAVQTSVDPKVIDCPDPRRSARTTLDGVAKNGIQLKARARVTVRTNLAQLIGGATEETIIARVGEGIVSAIGSCDSHKLVLANPMLIAKAVLDKSLDSQTAFEIVSIDIADIDVGDNIGARLQADQAEADVRVARARAEERRARAVASEQEMKALTAENRAKVVLAEAEVPLAIAEAYKMGRLRAIAN